LACSVVGLGMLARNNALSEVFKVSVSNAIKSI
jgi:hypothetical protein